MKKIIQGRNAIRWIKQLRLQPHPEGGYYRETYRSPKVIPANNLPGRYSGKRALATAIYFLLRANQFSAFHRLKSDEIWHFYAGSSLSIYIIAKEGKLLVIRMGLNTENKEKPQLIIPADTWFAAELNHKKSYALIGCTVAPGFDFADFEMASRKKLCRVFPRHRALIIKLTPPDHD